jgi:hypothetical protein
VTPEIVARVDAWIEARVPSGRGDPLVWLVNDWRKACALWRHRRAKDADDVSGAVASAQAAMRGVLLVLVRWAWGIPGLSVASHPSGLFALWRVLAHGEVLHIEQRVAWATEDEALVVALEAAPRREGS